MTARVAKPAVRLMSAVTGPSPYHLPPYWHYIQTHGNANKTVLNYLEKGSTGELLRLEFATVQIKKLTLYPNYWKR